MLAGVASHKAWWFTTTGVLGVGGAIVVVVAKLGDRLSCNKASGFLSKYGLRGPLMGLLMRPIPVAEATRRMECPTSALLPTSIPVLGPLAE